MAMGVQRGQLARGAALAAAIVAAAWTSGCARTSEVTRPEPATAPEFGPAGNAMVFAGPDAVPPGASFEFSRRDGAVALRSPAPLAATREWPEPMPYERPIRFRVWQQK